MEDAVLRALAANHNQNSLVFDILAQRRRIVKQKRRRSADRSS
jgi:hypothetical protein